VAEAVDVDGANVSVAASIGVAVGRDGVDGAKALLHRADMDMYRRKRRRQGSKR
jgi:predicted signal transduction protein with EAL and GGDEF domain